VGETKMPDQRLAGTVERFEYAEDVAHWIVSELRSRPDDLALIAEEIARQAAILRRSD
jgi:hypothetical protein